MEPANGPLSTPLGGNTVVSASEAVLASPLGGEVVLLEPEAGTYFSLNEVGARIWEMIRDPVSVESIARRIVEEYDVDPIRCREDVLLLLSELVEHGLAEIRPPDA
jgi:hypothetical protein